MLYRYPPLIRQACMENHLLVVFAPIPPAHRFIPQWLQSAYGLASALVYFFLEDICLSS